MGSVDNILVGAPVQIALYDSTNGVQFLGYLPEDNISVKGKPLNHSTVSGLSRQYGTKTTVQIKLLESDPVSLSNLMTRRAYKQTIYITGWNYGLKITNIYLTVVQERNFEIGEYDTLQLTGTTEVESDISLLQNLLGTYGTFNVDTDVDGLADGWGASGTITKSLTDPSFLNGAGDSHQNITLDDGEGIYSDVTWYLDQPVRMSFKVTVKGAGAGTHYVTAGANIMRSGPSITDSVEDSVVLSGTAQDTLQGSQILNPGVYDIILLRMRVYASGSTADIKVDDFMVQFGPLTAFTDNEN